jgi:CBS domain-containing protein
MQISEVLSSKIGPSPDEIISCDVGDKVSDALRLMTNHNIGAVVVSENGHIAGVYSERDVIRNCQDENTNFRDSSLGDLMSSDVIKIRPEQTIEEALCLMRDHRIRHLPVVNNDDHMVGFLSLRDLMNAQLEYANKKAEFLKDQIHISNKPLPM